MTIDEALAVAREMVAGGGDTSDVAVVLADEVRRLRTANEHLADQLVTSIASKLTFERTKAKLASIETEVQRIIVSLSRRLDADVCTFGPRVAEVLRVIRDELEQALRGTP